jgi:hypothetical protein
MKVAVIKSSQLGNCWSPIRFCGGRCQMVKVCTYPEYTTCKAVETERDYLTTYYTREIEKLNTQRDKAINTLNRRLTK